MASWSGVTVIYPAGVDVTVLSVGRGLLLRLRVWRVGSLCVWKKYMDDCVGFVCPY